MGQKNGKNWSRWGRFSLRHPKSDSLLGKQLLAGVFDEFDPRSRFFAFVG